MNAQGRTTFETERGKGGQDHVSSNGDWGERYNRYSLGESDDASKG